MATREESDCIDEVAKPLPNAFFVLLAEFDIDKGSTLRHQYPKPCGVSDSVLADWMLPAGAHLRETDWTVFFLRDEDASLAPSTSPQPTPRDQVKNDALAFTVRAPCFQFDRAISDWSPFNDTGPQRISFSVKTRKGRKAKYYLHIREDDAASDSSEHVESKSYTSLSIHPDIQFTLLQDRFCSLYPERDDDDAIGILFESSEDLAKLRDVIQRILTVLYSPGADSVISDDESSNKPLSSSGSNHDADQSISSVTERPAWPDGRLCCLNLVRTQMDDRVRRGAVCKAMAVCTSHQWFYLFKPVLLRALDKYFARPEVDVLTELYNAINHMKVPTITKSTELERRVLRASQKLTRDRTESISRDCLFQTSVQWGSSSMPIRIPLADEETSIPGTSVSSLLELCGDFFPLIYNAVLTEKRVVFLGHNQPASTVCNLVLSCCALVSPPLPDILDRVYPYASLTSLDFLQKPGFIAGVTNPIFEQRKEWWDLLCNTATGELVLSEDYERSLLERDRDGMLASVDSELLEHINRGQLLNYGENWIRHQFRDYTAKLISTAVREEPFRDVEEKKQWESANMPRLKEFLETSTFHLYEKERKARSSKSPFKKFDTNIRRSIRKLQVVRQDSDDLMKIFNTFLRVLGDRDTVLELIASLHPSQGGLFPIAVCMFNSDAKVRDLAFEVLTRIDQQEEGSKLIRELNYFVLRTYSNRMKTMEAAIAVVSPPEVHKSS